MLEGAIVIMPEDIHMLSEKSEQIIEALQKKKDMIGMKSPVIIPVDSPYAPLARTLIQSRERNPEIIVKDACKEDSLLRRTNIPGILYADSSREYVVSSACSSFEVCRTSYPEVARAALAAYVTEYLEG